MNAMKKPYGAPVVRTLGAAELIESLGPVSCGSASQPTGFGDPPSVVGRVTGNRGMN